MGEQYLEVGTLEETTRANKKQVDGLHGIFIAWRIGEFQSLGGCILHREVALHCVEVTFS